MAKPIEITVEDKSFFGHPIEGATYEVTLSKRVPAAARNQQRHRQSRICGKYICVYARIGYYL